MDFNVGDVVKTKKNHPCGSNQWQITRIGADFKLKCTKCQREILVSREKATKSIKEKVK